ncbi:hypothetical protein EVAR_94924_1 [Eumeta japonica]|uniref:Uncharacterized protein n=1 Tax=Eumeta variegata TaxID=151549 RepID=A0A4C1Z2F2_EUMVA|nr:hypothetical protein EVAR_94924_1 [Eumeta japonica]
MAADFSGLTSILQVWDHRVSSSMAFWRRGVIIRKLLPLRYRAVSSTKSASWMPVCGRGMSFVYGVKQRGECGALRNSSSNQSLADMLSCRKENCLFVR